MTAWNRAEFDMLHNAAATAKFILALEILMWFNQGLIMYDP